MVDWTGERVAELSDEQLKNLLANAQRKSASEIVALCTEELARRNAARPRTRATQRSDLREFEQKIAARIGSIGKEMAAKYDLSEETAKAKSAGVKGFRPHKLLDSKGTAKLGGHQRDGTVAIDRYISYRLGNQIVTLGVWLTKDAPIDSHEFHVSAPAAMIEDGKPFAEIRPGIQQTELEEGRLIRAFKDLPSAADAFDAALARITV